MASSDKVIILPDKVAIEDMRFQNISRRKYLIGPVIFLHLLGFCIYSGTTVLYYPFSIRRELFPNSSTEKEKSSICNTNTNTTNTENGKIIQSEVATFFYLCRSVCRDSLHPC